MLLREGVIAERLLDRRFHKFGGAAQTQATQLLDYTDGLLARCREVLARVNRADGHFSNFRCGPEHRRTWYRSSSPGEMLSRPRYLLSEWSSVDRRRTRGNRAFSGP